MKKDFFELTLYTTSSLHLMICMSFSVEVIFVVVIAVAGDEKALIYARYLIDRMSLVFTPS